MGRLEGDVPVSRQLLIHVLALSVGVSTVSTDGRRDDRRDDARVTGVEESGESGQQSGQSGQSGQSKRHGQHEKGQGQGQGQYGMKERRTEGRTEGRTEEGTEGRAKVPGMLRQAARRCWFALRHRVACWAVARPREVDVIMRWSARQVRR